MQAELNKFSNQLNLDKMSSAKLNFDNENFDMSGSKTTSIPSLFKASSIKFKVPEENK